MKEKYKYVVHSTNKSHTTVPKFLHIDQVPHGFNSIYAVTQESAEAITATGTTSQFKGVVWSERLWIDFDSYEEAESAGGRLEEMKYDFIAYDSGNRGMHFGILRDGEEQPSHLFPAMDKEWVRSNFPNADLSIYTHLHLFRVAGTRHEVSGREKRVVFEQRGQSLTLPPLKKTEVVNVVNYTNSNTSVFECIRVMCNSVPTSIGQRHATLVRLTYALKDDAEVDYHTALWWVSEVNKLAEQPKSDEQVAQIVGSIYK